LAVCLITEVRAAVRNTGMPARVPLAGGIQPAVHRLVTAALLLFSATTALSPAFAHHPPGPPSAVTSAPAGRSSGASPAATAPAAAPATPVPVSQDMRQLGPTARDTGQPGSTGQDTGQSGSTGRATGRVEPGEPGGLEGPAGGQGQSLEPP